jgi:hypothetical protein
VVAKGVEPLSSRFQRDVLKPLNYTTIETTKIGKIIFRVLPLHHTAICISWLQWKESDLLLVLRMNVILTWHSFQVFYCPQSSSTALLMASRPDILSSRLSRTMRSIPMHDRMTKRVICFEKLPMKFNFSTSSGLTISSTNC